MLLDWKANTRKHPLASTTPSPAPHDCLRFRTQPRSLHFTRKQGVLSPGRCKAPFPPEGALSPDAALMDTTELEFAIIQALSRARQDPKTLQGALSERLQRFKGKDYFPPALEGRVAVPSKEGKAAVLDAIAFLSTQPPLPALAEPTGKGFKLSAEDHLVDRGTRGKVGHAGADGSTVDARLSRYGAWSGKCGECLWFGREVADVATAAEHIVQDLVVDDGVPKRGHRLCIYDETYRLASARVGPHAAYGRMAVIEFAAEYESDDERVRRRVASGPPAINDFADETSSTTAWALGACCGCKQPVKGGSVIEIDKIGRLHKQCFKCVWCGTGLVGMSWKGDWTIPGLLCACLSYPLVARSLPHVPPPTHTGSTLAPRSEGIHCTTCYTANLAPACSACGNKIAGGVLRIKGKPEAFCSRACWDGMVKEGAATQRIPGVASKRGQRKQQATDGGATETKTVSAEVSAGKRGTSLAAAKQCLDSLALGYGDL